MKPNKNLITGNVDVLPLPLKAVQLVAPHLSRGEEDEIAQRQAEETAIAIKHMVIGSIVVEYGMLLMGDQQHIVKSRAAILLAAARSCQSALLNSPKATPELVAILKKEFLKSSYVLISELLISVWDLREEDLENLILSIKLNTESSDGEEFQLPDHLKSSTDPVS